jgi:hypothetical protein
MRLKSINEVNDFLAVVDSCNGDVWLESQYGDRFNLKSKLSQYVAIGALLSDSQEVLELFCSKEDEDKFFQYFREHPGVN